MLLNSKTDEIDGKIQKVKIDIEQTSDKVLHMLMMIKALCKLGREGTLLNLVSPVDTQGWGRQPHFLKKGVSKSLSTYFKTITDNFLETGNLQKRRPQSPMEGNI